MNMGTIFSPQKLQYLVSRHAPYLTALAFSVELKPDTNIPTLQTTPAGVLSYNPDFLSQHTQEQQVALVTHELYHILFRYWDRQKGRDQSRWNVAHDIEINQMIPDIPDTALHPEHFSLPQDETAEWYYDNLPSDVKSTVCKVEAGELSEKVKIGSDLSWVSIRNSNPDDLPRGLKRFAKPLRQYDPWLEIEALARDALAPEHEKTWTRPSRRLEDWRGSRHARTGKILVVIDTSGSIDDDTLTHALSLMAAIRPPVILGWGDTQLGGIIEYPTSKLPDLSGGGGTDMPEVCRQARAATPDCTLTVCLTDGQTSGIWDSTPYPLIIGIVGNNPGNNLPSWASIVKIGGQNG